MPATEVPTALVAKTCTLMSSEVAPIVHPSDDAKVFIGTVHVQVAVQLPFAT